MMHALESRALVANISAATVTRSAADQQLFLLLRKPGTIPKEARVVIHHVVDQQAVVPLAHQLRPKGVLHHSNYGGAGAVRLECRKGS